MINHAAALFSENRFESSLKELIKIFVLDANSLIFFKVTLSVQRAFLTHNFLLVQEPVDNKTLEVLTHEPML